MRAQLNPRYCEQLRALLAWPQSCGVLGGRPSSSLLFVGAQGGHVLFLDPHEVQEVRARTLCYSFCNLFQVLGAVIGTGFSGPLDQTGVHLAVHEATGPVHHQLSEVPGIGRVRGGDQALMERSRSGARRRAGRWRAGPRHVLLRRAAHDAAGQHRPLARHRVLLPHARCAGRRLRLDAGWRCGPGHSGGVEAPASPDSGGLGYSLGGAQACCEILYWPGGMAAPTSRNAAAVCERAREVRYAAPARTQTSSGTWPRGWRRWRRRPAARRC